MVGAASLLREAKARCEVAMLQMIWQALGDYHKEISTASSVAFSAIGVIIAVLVYRMNQRNNWGSKPQVWVPKLGGSFRGGREFHSFNGEFWNRRKYTIYPRMILVKFRTVDVQGLNKSNDGFHGDWMLLPGGWWALPCDGELKAQDKFEFAGEIPSNTREFELPAVRVSYFDPHEGEEIEVRQWRRRRWRFWRWYGPMRLRLAWSRWWKPKKAAAA